MLDERTTEMINKYLQRHFAVKRLKDDRTNRFKRGIVLCTSNGTDIKYFFRPKLDAQMLYAALYNDLEAVFGLSTEDLTPILFKYLYLNKYYNN